MISLVKKYKNNVKTFRLKKRIIEGTLFILIKIKFLKKNLTFNTIVSTKKLEHLEVFIIRRNLNKIKYFMFIKAKF